MSNDSVDYPSWLPRRPPPPGPQSTIQSSILTDIHQDDDGELDLSGFKRPTPRSVRIVNLPPKVKVRTGGPPTTVDDPLSVPPLPLPQPRFNAKNLHIQLLRSPSRWMKSYYYLWPFLIFYHLPLQSFFDFNAVYILLLVTKYPSPNSSAKSWALGATAYIACWLVWILIVLLSYEVIYSFARRWRLRRPLILPIYLSSPAFNLAALTSYSTFSFLQHIRLSALFQDRADAIAPVPSSYPYSKIHSHSHSYSKSTDDKEDPDPTFEEGERENIISPTTTPTASISQFLAESCYFYSQNLPTVALLLPRAGLCLALLFSFFSPSPTTTTTTDRDATFFNPDDGSLTGYAKGVLIANAAWTGWRTLVLLLSWFGLWLFSSNRLAGLCGPRHIWEEHSQEKTRFAYSSAASEHGVRNSLLYQPSSFYDYYSQSGRGNRMHSSYFYNEGYAGDELPWEWREGTRMRVQDAFEFCVTGARSRSKSREGEGEGGDQLVWEGQGRRRSSRRKKGKDKEESGGADEGEEGRTGKGGFEGIENVLAAIGFGAGAGAPGSPSGARRGVLTRDLFDTPSPEPEAEAEASPEGEGLDNAELQEVGVGAEAEAGPSTTKVILPLRTPKKAKRNSRDKDEIMLVQRALQPQPPVSSSLANTTNTTPTQSGYATPVPASLRVVGSTGGGNGSESGGLAFGAGPLLSLPYPFVKAGVGRVGSRDLDLVPFPGGAEVSVGVEGDGGRRGSGGTGTSGSGSGTGTGEDDEEEEDEDDDDEEEDDDDDDDDEESEDPSSNRGSESMSSLGSPISPRGYRSTRARLYSQGQGHTRTRSGVSSGMSSSGGQGTQGRRSISSGGTGVTGVSGITGMSGTGTGSFSGGGDSNRYSVSVGGLESLDVGSLGGSESRSISSSGSASASEGMGARGIPMPRRHPNREEGSAGQGQGQGRMRKVAISAPSSSSASSVSVSGSGSGSGSGSVRSGSGVSGARLNVVPGRGGVTAAPITIGGGERRRAESGPVVGGGIGVDVEGRYEEGEGGGGFEGYEWGGAGEEVEEQEQEQEDRVGLLDVPGDGTGTNGHGNGNGGGGRSRAHSFQSIISSASSKSKSRSRSRTHSHSNGNSRSSSSVSLALSVRERASSVSGLLLGMGMGNGSRVLRSRVNSSMGRLEEEREDGAGLGMGQVEGVGEFGERREVDGGGGGEGYASTASHSRSGSESLSLENYTFGRPVAFLRQDGGLRERERVEEEEEDDDERVDEGDEDDEQAPSTNIDSGSGSGSSGGDS